MKTHLDQTLDETTRGIQGKYEEGIKDYEQIVQHILAMADILSDGIVVQLPKKFGRKAMQGERWGWAPAL